MCLQVLRLCEKVNFRVSDSTKAYLKATYLPIYATLVTVVALVTVVTFVTYSDRSDSSERSEQKTFQLKVFSPKNLFTKKLFFPAKKTQCEKKIKM